MGTSEFAVPPLKKLHENHRVVAVITQPDRMKNRKGELQHTPVKQFALQNNLPVYQFEKIKHNCEILKSFNAQLFVTCAYGQILTKEILNIPKHGIYNIHASLLPKYRGAAPVQWALICGEKQTGITIMKTDEGIDTGDIILQQKTDIVEGETAGSLLERLSLTGADAIIKAIKQLESGTIKFTKQNEKEASYYPMIKKDDAKLDFSLDSVSIYNRIRAFNPSPVCFTRLGGKIFKVYRAVITERNSTNNNFGTVVLSDQKEGLHILCGRGTLRLAQVQLEGGKIMSDTELLRGRKIPCGSVLG